MMNTFMYAFSKTYILNFFHDIIRKVVKEIRSLKNEDLLNKSQNELENFYINQVTIQPLVLHPEDCYIENETSIQVDHVDGFGREGTIPKTSLDIVIPYEGDARLWEVQSSTSASNCPKISVKDDRIILNISFPDDSADKSELKSRIDGYIELLVNEVKYIQSDVKNHNRTAPDRIKSELQAKKNKAESAIKVVEGLGIPIKSRDESVPFTLQRKGQNSQKKPPKITHNVATTKTVLEEADYQVILKTLRSMSLVIERSPDSFAGLDEEAIRTHFLVNLNGIFEGNASGETFNRSGKTDILIRVDNRNVFIAECKFWKGPKAFDEAVDQLLSYLSWRDVKCALLIFNRNKDSTNVLKQMNKVMEKRGEHKKTLSKPDQDQDGRYIFVKNSDSNREIIITTQLYDIPK